MLYEIGRFISGFIEELYIGGMRIVTKHMDSHPHCGLICEIH